MNRKLTTILAGLSTAAAFAVNGSDWLHGGSASAGKFCVSAVFIVLVSLLLYEWRKSNVPADDCIGADCDWCGSRFAYDDGYPSGKFGAAAVYRVPRAVFRCDEFHGFRICRNASAAGGFGGVAVFCGGFLDS